MMKKDFNLTESQNAFCLNLKRKVFITNATIIKAIKNKTEFKIFLQTLIFIITYLHIINSICKDYNKIIKTTQYLLWYNVM